MDLCQVAVHLTFASSAGYCLIGRRLYFTKEWAGDEERRERTGVPDELCFAGRADRRRTPGARRERLSVAGSDVANRLIRPSGPSPRSLPLARSSGMSSSSSADRGAVPFTMLVGVGAVPDGELACRFDALFAAGGTTSVAPSSRPRSVRAASWITCVPPHRPFAAVGCTFESTPADGCPCLLHCCTEPKAPDDHCVLARGQLWPTSFLSLTVGRRRVLLTARGAAWVRVADFDPVFA
ncbi:hypothetical protein ACFCYB_37935 [Streptomyces sp. NPDC056309]|uniref:hypothetical protein n=1 Tax=unclassified Streptomyces TaxID=2593676 RepID=UPI0035E061A6